MRLLVTCSRTWRDASVVWQMLAGRLGGRTKTDPLVVVHGDAPQGDRLAADWVTEQAALGQPVRAEPHPADWRGKGRSAGFIRNAEMVSAGADECLAFIARCVSRSCARWQEPHGSHGATHCADLAEQAGIPTRRIWGWPQ